MITSVIINGTNNKRVHGLASLARANPSLHPTQVPTCGWRWVCTDYFSK